MNKKLLTVAVASAMTLPGISQAAFDDQGMEYISASEGLGGTMRFNIFHDVDSERLIDFNTIENVPNQDTQSTIDSLRIFYTGHLDLGGGLRSTYYWELRVQDDNGDNVFTEAYDIGIEGPFGKFEMGKINPTAERLVPGGSLDAALGSNDAAPTSDPHANGLRYETNSINGFEFGVSARMEDQTGDDDTVDDWSVAAKYTLPLGLEAGVAYETKTCFEAAGTVNACDAAASGLDDATGWRFGARYGQDNYLLAYEYRTYENFGGWDTNSRNRDEDDVAVDRDFDSLLEYNVHRVAIQATVDRVTLSANYSIAETEVNGYMTDDNITGAGMVDGDLKPVPKRTFDETALGVDASYALGSRSFIIIGYKTVETEVLGRNRDGADTNNAEGAAAAIAIEPTRTFDENTFLLRYRIDF